MLGQRGTSDRIPAFLPLTQEQKCPMKIRIEIVVGDDNDHEETHADVVVLEKVRQRLAQLAFPRDDDTAASKHPISDLKQGSRRKR
jgi:hypothetical protein